MSQPDGRIIIDSAIQTEGFEADAKKIEAAARRTAKRVDTLGREVAAFLDKYMKNANGAAESTNEMRRELERAKKTLQDLEKQGFWFGDEEFDRAHKQLARVQGDVNEYKKSLISVPKLPNPFDMSTIEGQLREAELSLERIRNAGKGLGDDEYDAQIKKVAELKEAYRAYAAEVSKTDAQRKKEADALAARQEKEAQAAMRQLEIQRKTTQAAFERSAKERDAAAAATRAAAEAAQLQLIGQNAQISRQDIVALNNELAELQARQSRLKQAGVGAGYAEYDSNAARIAELSRRLREYEASLTKTTPKTNRFAAAVQRLGQKLEQTAKNMLGLEKRTQSGRLSISQMLFNSLLISSVFSALTQITKGLSESFQGLAKESGQANTAISSMLSALKTLSNSIAGAFAPVLSVVGPIITKLINILTTGINYIGLFFAALTGQSTYKKAIPVQVDYADSLNETAGAAKNAADATGAAAKANDEYLSGLDEINKWQSKDSGGSSGAGGNGGSGGSGGASDVLYETVEVPSYFEGLADKLKQAWEAADFTEIGAAVANKLKEALDNIPWTGIKSTAEKIAKSIGTFINGAIEVDGLWETVGNTLAQGANTVLNFIVTALDTIHWDSVGEAITTTLSSLFKNLDWNTVGEGFSVALANLLDFAAGLIDGISWDRIPQDIGAAIEEALKGFNWDDVFNSVQRLINSAANAWRGLSIAWGTLTEWAGNLLSDIGKAISSAFGSYIDNFTSSISEAIEKALSGVEPGSGPEEIGAAVWLGICNGIEAAYSNMRTWIKKNLFDPFIDGIKKVFGIHSPASAPKLLEAAKNIGLGILNGIVEGFKNLPRWFKTHLLDPLVESFGDIVDWIKQIDFGQIIDDLINGREVDLAFDELAEKIKSNFSNIEADVDVTGQVTDVEDKREENDRKLTMTGIIGTLVKNLTDAQKTLPFKANVTQTATNKLTAAQKMLTMKGNVTSVSTPKKTPTVGIVANITSFVGKTAFTIRKLLGLSTGGIYKNGQWEPIQGYASGGSPSSARLFYANENGMPELVGRIGSNTAVMNNAQIVASVAAGVYKAVVAAFGQLQSYFASISMHMARIPEALQTLQALSPRTLPAAPMVASGTIIPPRALTASVEADGLTDALSRIARDLERLSLSQSKVSGTAAQSNSYEFVAQINRRTLFDEVITEAELRRMTTGRNPFELA